MSISYDHKKNLSNIEKHGLDFEYVSELDWDSAWVYEDQRNAYDEVRYIAYGTVRGRLHFVCFTETEDGIRVISFRKANDREVKRYEKKTID